MIGGFPLVGIALVFYIPFERSLLSYSVCFLLCFPLSSIFSFYLLYTFDFKMEVGELHSCCRLRTNTD